MKNFLLIAICAIASVQLQAQSKTLKHLLTLQMPRTADDDMPGTRGACVAWHPVQKKYYAVMAGNAGYPLGIFDAAGKLLSDKSQNCYVDTRGLWYNPAKKRIEGNAYSDYGWFYYKVNQKGEIVDTAIIVPGKNQPTDQCVGAMNSLAKEVVFLDDKGTVYSYASDGSVSANILSIYWGVKNGGNTDGIVKGETPLDYNNTTVVYTGIKGSEIGFLNTEKRQVELYDITTGYLSSTLSVPADIPLEFSFNFAYCNNMYWFFNIEKRTWLGCK